MSLADELERIYRDGIEDDSDLTEFMLLHKDAILAALRGRDAVLEEAKVAILAEDEKTRLNDYMLDASECAAVIDSLKSNWFNKVVALIGPPPIHNVRGLKKYAKQVDDLRVRGLKKKERA